MFNTLKNLFTFTLILIHWISNIQMIMETNTSEYVLTAIFLTMMEEKEVHPVVFHSCTLKAAKLNYDIYNKELLIVFEAFCI